MVRGIESRVKRILSNTVGDTSVKYNSLASIGITTADDGTLEFDSSKLDSALSGNIAEVRNLFVGNSAALQTDHLDNMSFANIPSGESESSLKVDITQAAAKAYYWGGNVSAVFDPYLVGDTPTARPDFTLSLFHNFSITVDGETAALDFSATQTFSGLNMGEDLAVFLQSRINAGLATKSVSVTYETGGLKFTSDTYGSAGNVAISAPVNIVRLRDDIGLTIGAGVAGKDVEGTIGFESATGVGQVLTADDGTSYDNGADPNLAITYSGSLTSSRANSQEVDGLLGDLDNLLDSFLDSDGIFSARSDGYQNQLEEIAGSRERLDLRVSALESRLISQFSAMDALVANLNSTSDFISNQLKNLPSATRK